MFSREAVVTWLPGGHLPGPRNVSVSESAPLVGAGALSPKLKQSNGEADHSPLYCRGEECLEMYLHGAVFD
jgi:hypothetical protein